MDRLKSLKLMINTLYFIIVLIIIIYLSKKIEVSYKISPTLQLAFFTAIKETIIDYLLLILQKYLVVKYFQTINNEFKNLQNNNSNQTINYLYYNNIFNEIYAFANEQTKKEIDDFRLKILQLEKKGIKYYNQI
ncbi:MAG: hypothetical protein IPN10_07185 [Saprospiraceae bacterium]|nr:hypothetical protein [Saprospiraceae bacterium]